MKGSGGRESPGLVKRFKYNAPKKKETLPEQWSSEFRSKGSSNDVTPSSSTGGASGFGLNDAWSIRKNVAVGPNKAKNPSHASTSVYSRHKNTNSTNLMPTTKAETNSFHSRTQTGKAFYSSTATSLIPQMNPHSKPTASISNVQYSRSFGTVSANRSFGATPSCQITPCKSSVLDQKRSTGRRSDQSSVDSPFDF